MRQWLKDQWEWAGIPIVICGSLVSLLLLVLLISWIDAGYKAKAYSRVTGIEVSQSEMFWLKLDAEKELFRQANVPYIVTDDKDN